MMIIHDSEIKISPLRICADLRILSIWIILLVNLPFADFFSIEIERNSDQNS